MKIISLNTWGGRAGKELLLDFFRKYQEDTDIFCLQEIWADRYDDLEGANAGGRPINQSAIMTHALQEISEVLSEHVAYFRPHYRNNYGLCIFVRKDLTVQNEGEVFVHKFKDYEPLPEGEVGNHARNIQYMTVAAPSGPQTVINFHGLWNGRGKSDSDERLVQSDRIVEFFETLTNPYVFCGDFNLTPDTESLKKFENIGLHNLVATHGVTSTRTSFYDKPGRFADYAFVSDGVTVNDFKVLPDEVSDHAPLYLEIA